MASAKKELDAALTSGYYYFLVNDTVSQAVLDVQNIIAGTVDLVSQHAARHIAQQIRNTI